MATYKVETDRGTFEIDGPDDASHDELMQAVEDHMHGSPSEPNAAPQSAQGSLSGQNVVPGSSNPSQSEPTNKIRLALDTAKAALSAPVKAGKALLTNPTKVAAETPILPIGGALVAGPAGGAIGEGLHQMAQITRGAPAPSPAQSALRMAGAAFAPKGLASVGRGAKAVASTVGDLAAPSVEKAGAELLPILEKHGLKDVAPVIFNKGEREAAVQYAKNQAELATKGALDPVKLQEARSTLKDVLDNRIIAKNSPTGQIVSRAKETVTNALSKARPEVGKALKRLGRAHEAVPTKAFISKIGGEARRGAIQATLTALGAGALYKTFK